jgi:hypothetical protein
VIVLLYDSCHYLQKYLFSKSNLVAPIKSGKSKPSSSQHSIDNVEAPGNEQGISYDLKNAGLLVFSLNDSLSVIVV